MSSTVSIAEARNRLPRLVHEVEEGEPITLTRRGKPVAVLVSWEEHERVRKAPDFSDAYARFSRRYDLESLGLDPEELFPRSRELDGGRETPWS